LASSSPILSKRYQSVFSLVPRVYLCASPNPHVSLFCKLLPSVSDFLPLFCVILTFLGIERALRFFLFFTGSRTLYYDAEGPLDPPRGAFFCKSPRLSLFLTASLQSSLFPTLFKRGVAWETSVAWFAPIFNSNTTHPFSRASAIFPAKPDCLLLPPSRVFHPSLGH